MPKTLAEQRLAALRERAETDLYWFAKEILGYDKLVEPLHKSLCDNFFVRKDSSKSLKDQSPIKERLLLWPRDHFKTTLDIADTLQWLLVKPDIRILLMSGTLGLVRRMVHELTWHITSNPRLRQIEPRFQECPPDFGKVDEFTIPTRKRGHLREPSVSISTVDAVKAGSHFDIIKCDDIVNEINTGTREQIEKVVTAFNYTTPLLDPDGYRDIIGTRYDYSDLYGWIMEQPNKERAIEVKAAWYGDTPGQRTVIFPERFTEAKLDKIRQADPYLFNCFPAGSKVLMSDWTERRIETLKVGEEIVGYGNATRHGVLCRAVVQHVHTEEAEVIEAVTESGRRIRCTPDHKFLVSRHRERNGGYKPLHVGFNLCSVYAPSPPQTSEEQRLLDWLGGMIDGEGSVGSVVSIAQSPTANPEVHAALHKTLQDLGIKYNFRDDCNSFILAGGKTLKTRFLQHAKITKRSRFLKALWKRNGRISESNDRVVAIYSLGKERVYNIQSSSGNYVCEGFATKNCQYLNDPTPTDAQYFTEALLTSHILPVAHMPRAGRTFITWDLGFSQKQYSDYSVGAVGIFNDQGQLFIVDILRGRFSPSEIINAVVGLAKKWRPVKIGIEKAGGSELLDPALRNTKLYLPIDWIKINTNRTKIERVMALESLLRTNNLYLSAGLPDLDELKREFMRFPRYKHDDQPDAISMLLNYKNSVDHAWADMDVDLSHTHANNVNPDEDILGTGING